MPAEMLYAILSWNEEDLKWEVVFYTFNYDDYLKNRDRYHNETHMISLRGTQYHEMMEKIRGLKFS